MSLDVHCIIPFQQGRASGFFNVAWDYVIGAALMTAAAAHWHCPGAGREGGVGAVSSAGSGGKSRLNGNEAPAFQYCENICAVSMRTRCSSWKRSWCSSHSPDNCNLLEHIPSLIHLSIIPIIRI